MLAVLAARYGKFKDELQALHQVHDSSQPWVAEMPWQHDAKPDKAAKTTLLPSCYRLAVDHHPDAAHRRAQARRKEMTELVAVGEKWGGRPDEQDQGNRG